MLSVTKIVTIVFLLAITSVGFGQASETPYKLKYEISPDLPNGIAFFMTLRQLDHFSKQIGRADAVGWVEQELGMSNVDADVFVSQALTTLDVINTDIRARQTRLACEYAGPSVNKKAQFAALQQMYDIEKAVYDHYYDQTKASLTVETGERLQQWMDDRKLSIGYFEIDFEKSSQKRGSDPVVTLSGMCGAAK